MISSLMQTLLDYRATTRYWNKPWKHETVTLANTACVRPRGSRRRNRSCLATHQERSSVYGCVQVPYVWMLC